MAFIVFMVSYLGRASTFKGGVYRHGRVNKSSLGLLKETASQFTTYSPPFTTKSPPIHLIHHQFTTNKPIKLWLRHFHPPASLFWELPHQNSIKDSSSATVSFNNPKEDFFTLSCLQKFQCFWYHKTLKPPLGSEPLSGK